MDLRLALMCGIDIPIVECQLIAHQPTIKEISFIGEQDFFLGVQTLNVHKGMISQGETLLTDMNNFYIFMTIMTEASDKKEAVKKVLQLTFPQYKIVFLPRSLIFKREQENSIIDENNFEFLQNTLKDIYCLTSSSINQGAFNPADDRAAEIAKKLMRGRERVAAQNRDGGNTSIFSQYISTLTVGLNSMSLEDCMNLTMYQLLDLEERYMLYINWDMDIRSRLAGGKPDSQPDNWMKNIH